MMRKIPVEIRVRNRVPVCEVVCPLTDKVRSTRYCRGCDYFDGTVYGSSIVCLWRDDGEEVVKNQ